MVDKVLPTFAPHLPPAPPGQQRHGAHGRDEQHSDEPLAHFRMDKDATHLCIVSFLQSHTAVSRLPDCVLGCHTLDVQVEQTRRVHVHEAIFLLLCVWTTQILALIALEPSEWLPCVVVHTVWRVQGWSR